MRRAVLREQERLNRILLRDVVRQQRRAVRDATGDPLAIVDAVLTYAPLRLTLTDRDLDLRLRRLEAELGLPDSGAIPWAPDDEELIDTPITVGMPDGK